MATFNAPLFSSPRLVTNGLPQKICSPTQPCFAASYLADCRATVTVSPGTAGTQLASDPTVTQATVSAWGGTAQADSIVVSLRLIVIETVQTLSWLHEQTVVRTPRAWCFVFTRPRLTLFQVISAGWLQQVEAQQTTPIANVGHSATCTAAAVIPSRFVEAFQGDFPHDH